MQLLQSKTTIMKLIQFLVIILVFPSISNAWLTGIWNKGSDNVIDLEDIKDDLDADNNLSPIHSHLADSKCPARAHRKLNDYWACLWQTSLTAEAIEEEQNSIVEDYMKQWQRDIEAIKRHRLKRMLEKTFNVTSSSKRVNRTKRRGWSNSSHWDVRRTSLWLNDIAEGMRRNQSIPRYCQSTYIGPGRSLFQFINCLREYSPRRRSFQPTYLPKSYPDISQEKYDKREIEILDDSVTELDWGKDFSFQFTRLTDEDAVENFQGADPYLEEQVEPFRYKYDNLQGSQRQPGWSFSGSDAPPKWHTLDVKKFYLPIKSQANLKDMSFLPDLPQSYPGIGEIAEEVSLNQLQDPLDYRWSKDSGYHAYTRFLMPLLTKKDISYYQSKGEALNAQARTDLEVANDIIEALDIFQYNTSEEVGKKETEDEVPFVGVYREFLVHYLKMDVNKYRAEGPDPKPGKQKTLNLQYNVVRNVFKYYVEGVKAQEICVREMVKQYDYRRDEFDAPRLIEEAFAACTANQTAQEEASNKTSYKVDIDLLQKLYNGYFDRKEARQRYSLPVYPIKFPICKHSEPSPIDIVTTKGRKSSLRSYRFGGGAFRLNRFFVEFPNDGSNLLSLGLVNGERLDDSTVRLTGGAVKAQNLSFQYMHIRFAKDWKLIGSEHHMDGKGAQMELQMIFTIAGSADKIKYWHVLARVHNQLFQFREKLIIILAVLVDVLPTQEDVNKKAATTNQDPFLFEPLAQAVYHFRKQAELHPDFASPRGYVSRDPVFRFIDFIPRVKSKFFTYRGSLSWPPCFGYVLWSVFQERLYMSKRQFDEFAKIPAFGMSDDNLASRNFRRFSDIYVEEENAPNVNYAQRQAMINKRTVDRYILEGVQDPDENTVDKGAVEEEIYYLDQTYSGVAVKRGAPSLIFVYLGTYSLITRCLLN